MVEQKGRSLSGDHFGIPAYGTSYPKFADQQHADPFTQTIIVLLQGFWPQEMKRGIFCTRPDYIIHCGEILEMESGNKSFLYECSRYIARVTH